jgi:hypothetical protein
VDNVNSQGFNVSRSAHYFFLETCCDQKAEAAENGLFFNSLAPELHVQHTKLLESRPKPAVCMSTTSTF